nr:electron transfer flavoprotein beta subunit lysine methyltransferase isoform X2 [Rattus norvegicus]
MAFSLCWKAPRSQWSFLQALNSGFPLFPWRTVGSCLDLKMKAYLEENTEVTSSGSLTPEIQLRLLTPRCKFWWERADLWPYSDPYWAIYWPGGQALSRYLLDNPDVVRGKSVLDLGSGCGATAIAAKMSGASNILANDVDPIAGMAITLNCKLNGLNPFPILTKNILNTRQVSEAPIHGLLAPLLCAEARWDIMATTVCSRSGFSHHGDQEAESKGPGIRYTLRKMHPD